MIEYIRIKALEHGVRADSEIARRCGWSAQNFHNKAVRDNFSVDELRTIAAALGYTLDIRFNDETEKD